MIQGAILHDTVEDTDTTLDEIEAEFGKAVRDIVDEVSDDKDLEKLERKRMQIVHAKHASNKVGGDKNVILKSSFIYEIENLDKIQKLFRENKDVNKN